jgi:hypothetical protein
VLAFMVLGVILAVAVIVFAVTARAAEDNLILQQCREQLARIDPNLPADRITAHCTCRWEQMFKVPTSTGEPITGQTIAGALRGRASDVAEMETVKRKAFEVCKGELGW